MSPWRTILITGGAGFIGQLLAARLLDDDSFYLILNDIIKPPIPKGVKYPQNAFSIKADLCDPSSVNSLLSTPECHNVSAIYLFHGIMSSASEADHQLGLRVNVDATRCVLDSLCNTRLREPTRPLIRVIYASSLAIYGQPLPAIVTDATTPTPESSYGSEKLMCETLINDLTRRDIIDGLILRFPTISIRPGKPTGAASSFLSGIIREPLNGIKSTIPVQDLSFKSWLGSPRTLCENLIIAQEVDTGRLQKHVRSLNLPGMSVSIKEMLDALREVGGEEAVALVSVDINESMQRILRSWPTEFETKRAEELGFVRDMDYVTAVRDYKASLKLDHKEV